MVPVNRDSSQPAPAVATETPQEKKEETKTEDKEVEDPTEPSGDPEIAPIYVKQLLPVFTHVFQSTMLPSVRLEWLTVHFQN